MAATEERDDKVARPVDDSRSQLFATGKETRPVYGMGARGYGMDATATRGRKVHVQFREQNSGFAPAEDYRGAKFLPGRWQDLDRNGCPVVLEGGELLGIAAVENVAGDSFGEFVHQVMPANAGVRQNLVYSAMDRGVAVDIDSLFDGSDNFAVSGLARVVGAKITEHFVSGNKSFAYNPTNYNSSAWEDVFTNQKFEGQITTKVEWLVMYPVSDIFMHGVTLGSGVTSVNDDLAFGVEGAARSDFGFADVNINSSAAVALRGIRAGDYVMANPYLPGKLISIDDFAALAVADKLGTSAGGATGLAGVVGVAMGKTAATITLADAMAYAMQHKVGRCFKRQPRATYNKASGQFTDHDIYASTYKYMLTVPGLGLSGGESDGFEADQEAGRQFAKALASQAGMGGASSMDVVFINYELR